MNQSALFGSQTAFGKRGARKDCRSAATVEGICVAFALICLVILPIAVEADQGSINPSANNPTTAGNGVTPSYAVIDLGTSYTNTEVINNLGHVLESINGTNGSAVWENGVIHPLQMTGPGSSYVAKGMNDSDRVVGFGSNTAVAWPSPDAAPQPIGPAPYGLFVSAAYSISKSGVTMGSVIERYGSNNFPDIYPASFTGGSLKILYPPNPPQTNTSPPYSPALACYDSAVADSLPPGAGYHWIFYGYDSSLIYIGESPFESLLDGQAYPNIYLYGVNSQGIATGSDANYHAMMMGALSASLPYGGSSAAGALNNHTVMNGTSSVPAPQILGNDNGAQVLWESTNGMTYTENFLNNLISPNTWQLSEASSINDSGAIVGTATSAADEQSHGGDAGAG